MGLHPSLLKQDDDEHILYLFYVYEEALLGIDQLHVQIGYMVGLKGTSVF